ncbi:MAG: serine/threonine protein kinase, partial [Planctomycetes bacterium]|nr:serine/threonine protein kinase [Planctomycetota bacterium]
MDKTGPYEPTRSADSIATRIDLACDELEAAWQRQEQPRIEEYLVGFSESDRPRVLRELLLVELAYRRSREEPKVEEYRERFPEHAEVIEAAFCDSQTTELPPADHATARNLLLGIFAFEHSLIDIDTLLTGLRAWVSDKTQSMGEILEQRGKLSSSDHDLLRTLLCRHLAVHEDSAQRSLASLSLVGAAWKQLGESIPDPEIRTCLRYLSGEPGTGGSSQADHPRSAGASSSAGSRFQIVRFHKEGGLGQVWVATDAELHRDVALKDIKARHADVDEFRSRFVTEAEITGGLEHPGVVPVYGLGQYEDGRPFYVMRFIRGDSLADALERFHAPEASRADPTQRALELRQLLGRFIDVCNAIEYAHSRGVLHRDLKPGNIMLGEYGETLVVDWGLAKASDQFVDERLPKEQAIRPTIVEGSVPTQMGSAMGTPQYMSPEQAAGRLDEMGAATDVYSLGATLYCVLTGRPPFGGSDVSAILENVRAGRFPRPRERRPGLPRALEAICLKAMALEPAGRYDSPRQLAEEVERWLADEPVGAMKETPLERLSRWARKNRTWVQAGAAALVLVAVVSVVAAVLVNEQRLLVDMQRRKAEQLAVENAQLAADERLAREQAQRQLDRARRNWYAYQLSNVQSVV